MLGRLTRKARESVGLLARQTGHLAKQTLGMFVQRAEKVGLPPGSLVYVGERKVADVHVSIMDYSPDSFEEDVDRSIETLAQLKQTNTVSWLNVTGLHEVEIIRRLGAAFDIHPLVQEDILNTRQRPKVDEHDAYLYIVLKMLVYSREQEGVEAEQISLILTPRVVISFQEREGDAFEAIRDRIRTGKGRIRLQGTDYLVYALIDAIVDHYFIVLEQIGDRIGELEQHVLGDPQPETPQRIYRLKNEVRSLRRAVTPVRELVLNLERNESGMIHETTQVYLRDVYDHVIRAAESAEMASDRLTGLMDMYLSVTSHRMNEVMKVLTIIATVFMPLSFLAGIYGMNFEHMPELRWKWAYPALLGAMAVVVAAMLVYFKRKRWL